MNKNSFYSVVPFNRGWSLLNDVLLVYSLQCADMLDLNWGEIERCTNSGEGKDLLAESGAQSLIVKPHLSFIPTVALNGDFSGQNLRLKNLLSTVCNAYNVSICFSVIKETADH